MICLAGRGMTGCVETMEAPIAAHIIPDVPGMVLWIAVWIRLVLGPISHPAEVTVPMAARAVGNFNI